MLKIIEAIVMAVFGVVLLVTSVITNYYNGIIFGSLLTAAGIGFILACIFTKKSK